MAPAIDKQTPPRRLWWSALGLAVAGLCLPAAHAQNYPVTNDQRSKAEQVAQAGVPLADLAEGAPDEYTVKSGDTLWAISGMYLKTPWRWPELWGMNMQEVRNPHRIYPGQQLVLEKSGGRARLRLRDTVAADGTPAMEAIRVSPRTRIEPLPDASVPTLKTNLIEPFLAEPIVVEESVLDGAPRIVAAPENRVLITRGDRAYARGQTDSPLKQRVAGRPDDFRVFRNARPLRDPDSREVLGYEAQYLGKASLVRNEGSQSVPGTLYGSDTLPVPATLDIVVAKEEMRVGDRLLPEPPRQFTNYVPHAPAQPVAGSIVSIYGDSVSLAGQNQIVVINKGTADGIESGHVLALLKSGARVRDRSQPGARGDVRLPDERNGLLMVFRPFERVSYALILEINDGVKVGDHFANPR